MHSLKNLTHQRSTRWHRAGTRRRIESAVATAARRCTINSVGITGYAWDNANQLTGIAFKLPGQPDRITSYTHDAAGQMTAKTLPGANGNPGIKSAYSFDAAGRLTQIEWRNPPYALADQIDAIQMNLPGAPGPGPGPQPMPSWYQPPTSGYTGRQQTGGNIAEGLGAITGGGIAGRHPSVPNAIEPLINPLRTDPFVPGIGGGRCTLVNIPAPPGMCTGQPTTRLVCGPVMGPGPK